MKSKIYNFLIFLILSNIFFLDAYSQNQFNFNVTNVEVLQNGNIYKGLNKCLPFLILIVA